MKLIETTLFILMVSSFGLLGLGLLVSVVLWLLFQRPPAAHDAWRERLLHTSRTSWQLISKAIRTIGLAWRRYRARSRIVSIEFLVAGEETRRELEPCLRKGLSRLARSTGTSLPPEVSVMVQRVLGQNPEMPGFNQTLALPDGRQRVLLRLALEVGGKNRTKDQLLVTMAEQYIALVSRQLESPTATSTKTQQASWSLESSGTEAQPDESPQRVVRVPQLVVLARSPVNETAVEGSSQDAAGTFSGDPLIAQSRRDEKVG